MPQWIALPHTVKPTGYKAKNAYGHSPVFPSDTYDLRRMLPSVQSILSMQSLRSIC
jgi:hypothetical protein